MFRKTILWLFILLSIMNSPAKAQQLINDKIDVIAGSGEFLFNCVIYKPANFSTTKQYPLVLFFHGMGEAGTDVNEMYRAGLPKVLKDGYRPPFDFIMVAPQHNSYSLDPKHLEQVLNESIRKFPNIDQSRVYLTGLSAGGNTIYVSSLNINQELPKRFAGMVVMSGATQGINKDNFYWWKNFRTPLWAVVGENDPSYVGQNELVVNEVNKQVPGLASLTIRPGIGHGGWNDVYNGLVKNKDGKNMWDYLYQFSRVNGAIVTGNVTTPTAPTNVAPAANAGTDKTITLPTSSVQLTGSGNDADGSISSYTWTKVSGPTQFAFSSTTTASPVVSNLVQGTYTFRLTVKDNVGAADTDDVLVTVNGTTTTPTPTGTRAVKVNLFGGSYAYASTEWNNWNTSASKTSSYFKYNDGSSSSIRAVISTQNAVTDNSSTYTITMAPKEVGRYTSYSNTTRTLTISGLDNSKTYNLELYASRKGISNNTTRFTTAGRTIDVKTDDNLDQKASFTSVAPTNGQIVITLAKLNTYNYLNGFMLTESGTSSTSTQTSSTTIANQAPVVNAGSDNSLTLPTNFTQLYGTATDGDGSIASYSWSKISGPAQYTLNNTSLASPALTNLVEGTYTFRLTVTDNDGATASDDVNIYVSASTATSTTSTTVSTKEIRVNLFGGSNSYLNAGWNNWNTYSSLSSSSFNYSDGSGSAVKASISSQSSVSDNGSSYTTIMAPKEVGRYASYSNTNRTLTITGLDNSRTYTLELFASRNGISNNTTRFTVGTSIVDVKTDNNLEEKAVFTVVPVNGTITVSIAKLNSYNYLNGFILK